MKLTTEETRRILGLIHHKHNYISNNPANLVGNQEFFCDMKFNIKLGHSHFDDCFVCWDYSWKAAEPNAHAFVQDCMKRTQITVDAVVEDNGIYFFWQGQKKFQLEYNRPARMPAAPTFDKVRKIFRKNAGIPEFVLICVNWL